jgi:hypothetical protein
MVVPVSQFEKPCFTHHILLYVEHHNNPIKDSENFNKPLIKFYVDTSSEQQQKAQQCSEFISQKLPIYLDNNYTQKLRLSCIHPH